MNLRPALRSALETIDVSADDLRELMLGDGGVGWYVTRGESALAHWEYLQARATETGCWPVVLGDPSEIDDVVERSCARDTSVARMLEEASKTRPDPHEWAERGFAESRRYHHAQGIHIMCRRSECASGILDDDEPDVPEVAGPMPEGIAPVSSLTIPYVATQTDEALTWNPRAEVAIALLPTPHPWEVGAHLRFGAFNACPFPAEHVALHRHWFDAYGAVVFGMTHDEIEMLVRRPPRDPEQAVALARVHRSYSEEWDRLSLAQTAARLLGAPVWRFWWD